MSVHTSSLANRIAALPGRDKRLVRGLFAAALLALALGVGFGWLTALGRAGAIGPEPEHAARLLTLHGVSVFFYWLYLAQAALLLVLAAAERDGGGLALRSAAWSGAVLMLLGFAVSEIAGLTGTPLLYDGAPALGRDDPAAVGWFSLGYLLLAAGLAASSLSAIATVTAARADDGFSAVGFALFAWAGFLIVSAVAAVNAFLPSVLWALGLGAFPADQPTEWHILFHNLHYLPLMATVLVWYVLVEELTGVSSVHGARFSKIVFASYLLFVPPTSLYHMFLEPGLSEGVRVVGSLLSLFVAVPTFTAFLIIVSSLEMHARSRGATGRFGWIGALPWGNPVMTAIGCAALNLGLGLTFAFVLIQEKLAPLLSDTFFVPGYFHFFAVGTVSLSFLAAMMVVLPALTAAPLWRPKLMSRMPALISLGLLVFGAAGIAAGFNGVPRRTFDVGYGGEAPALWHSLMAVVGGGGTLFAIGLTVMVTGVALTLVARPDAGAAPLPTVAWGGAPPRPGVPAWTGTIAVLATVVAMALFTIVAFEIMHALPLLASGGGGHAH